MASLLQAAQRGDLEALTARLLEGHSPNLLVKGKTALAVAVEAQQIESCRLLIQHGANVSLKDRSGVTPLCAAIQKRHQDMISLLLSRCDGVQETLSLDTAVASGLHDTAHLMLANDIVTCRTKIVDCPPHDIDLFLQPETFSQWQQFLENRSDRLDSLHPLHVDYVFILACRQAQLDVRLVNSLQKRSEFDINCQIRVGPHVVTPLTSAAELGHLEVIQFLLGQPGIDNALCGSHGWPPFLQLLRNRCCVSTADAIATLEVLGADLPGPKIEKDAVANKGPFEIIFENLLRSPIDDLVHRAIDIIHGVAGTKIIPLLIRSHRECDVLGLRWLLGQECVAPQFGRLWITLCEYLMANEDAVAFELLLQVARTYAQRREWPLAILKCLTRQNFQFIKQFFFQPGDARFTEETLRGYRLAAADDELIREWERLKYASAVLWDAIGNKIWRGMPAFESIIADRRIDPNQNCFQMRRIDIKHKFIRQFPEPGTDSINPHCLLSTSDRLQDFQMQLAVLERRKELQGKTMTSGSQLCPMNDTSDVGQSIFTWAAQTGDMELLKAVMKNPRLAINARDFKGHTALMYAVVRRDIPMVTKLLTRKDILLNVTDDEGRSALFYAAQSGQSLVVEKLIQTKKAFLSIRDSKGWTALDYANHEGHAEVVRLLTIKPRR